MKPSDRDNQRVDEDANNSLGDQHTGGAGKRGDSFAGDRVGMMAGSPET